MPKYNKWVLLICGIVFLIPFLAYYTVLFNDYAYIDDYIAAVVHQADHAFNLKTSYSVDGRPILSVITILCFGLVESIEGVGWIRLISLTGMAIYGLAAFIIFHRFRLPLYYSFLLACLILLNPGSGVYAGWAITVAFPVSILCSLLAAAFWLECLDTGRKVFGLIAFVLLLAAFLTYQPTAFICTAILAVKFMETDGESSWKLMRQWVYSLMFVSFSLVAYYVMFKLYLPFVRPPSSGPIRSDIVKDYWGKLDYYVNGPLKSAFIWWGELWKDGNGNWLLCLFIPLVLLTFWIVLKRRGWLMGGASLALFAASILLASATVLVPHVNTAQMRVFFPIYILTGILFSIGVMAFLRRFQNDWAGWIGVSVVVGTMLLSSHYYVKEGIVSPNAKEVDSFKSYLKEEITEVPRYLFFIHPIGANSVLSKVKTSHEYGLYSSWTPWVPKSMINLMLKKQFPDREIELGTIDVIQVYPWQHYEFPENSIVIDGGFVLQGIRTPPYTTYKTRYLPGVAPGRRNDAVFGDVEGLNGNWFFSDVFGFIRKRSDGRYLLLQYGVFSVSPLDTDSGRFIFQDQDGDEFEITEKEFPRVINRKTKEPQLLAEIPS